MSMSLPTPPRTTQKNKENVPPISSTPSTSGCRTLRIVWSQENLHHAYSTQIRQLPSSSCAKEPHKSILKKPAFPFMSLMPPEGLTREVTPEPADPLQHPLYLNSPVSTLVTSLQPGSDAKITLADLTEAYSVLSARLKAKMHTIVEMCGPIPALEPLREHSSKLVETFHRDIGRAFVNPQGDPPPHEDSPWSSPSSVGSVKKRGYTDQEVKHARDLCNLCHAAMRCFSNIALAPVLSSIFDDSQLGVMLTDVLAIPLAPSLPTPNSRKTCQIAVWILQVQRLPTAVLEPAADRIAYALRRGIDGELGREGKKGSASDGLKAVAVLVSNQPTIFLRPFGSIISSVLNHLTSQNLALRLQAAYAILALSYTVAHTPSSLSSILEPFRQATSTYITSQQNMRKSPQDLSPLGKEFRACFETDIPMHAAQSPIWALSIIASFIVLAESSVFTQSKTIKFVLGHLRAAMGVKRTTVRATAGLVWRALVWACVRLDGSDQTEEHRDTGWKVVRQILDGAIGVSVVAALVGQEDRQKSRVVLALEAVRTMIKKGGRTCEEGVDVLERLLSVVGSGVGDTRQDVWRNHKLLVGPLFNGTLLQAEWKGLVSHVKDALSKCVAIQDVTPLSETEVVQHWDALFDIWKEAVEKAPLGEDGETPPALLSVWQALLLTQAQLTQGFEHLTSTPDFILNLTDLLNCFLSDASLEWSLDASAPSWSSQTLKLGFVRNLWVVARNVFTASTLAGSAQTLLCEILKREYLLNQNEVRDAWAALCAELVLAGMPSLMRELWKSQGQVLDSEMKQELWRVVSKRWIEEAGSSDGAIELISAPFAGRANWTLDTNDLELWVRLVDCALVACAPNISTITTLDKIAIEIGVDHSHGSLYASLPYLLSGVHSPLHEHQNAPSYPHILLKLTNDVLAESYPPSHPRDKQMVFPVVGGLREIVASIRQEFLVDFLVSIQDGIRIWITDELAVFTEDEYNEHVISFYVDSLEALKKLPTAVDTLHTLCPLLTSSFHRVPEPALGPSAFKSFWTKVYKPIAPLSTELPEDLKPILRAIQAAMCEFGEELGYRLSPETQTQDLATMELPLSVVPDSLENDTSVEISCNDNALIELGAPPWKTEVSQNFEQQRITTKEVAYKVQGADNDSSHLTGISSALSNELDNTAGLASTALEPPSPLIPPDADHSLSFYLSNNPDQSVLLGEVSPALVSNHDSFLVGETGILESALVAETRTSTRAVVVTPRLIKEELLDVDPNTAMILGSSQDSCSSQQSRSNLASRKRRKSRLLSQPSKKRKTVPDICIDILNVSDDEDSEQVALNRSIVVAPTKRRKSLEMRILSQQVCQQSTPKSELQSPATSSSRKKRTFLEAVEVPTLEGLLKQRNADRGASEHSGRRKSLAKSHLPYCLRQMGPAEVAEQPPCPVKRRNLIDSPAKGESVEGWNESHRGLPCFDRLSSLGPCGGEDAQLHFTPEQPSDTSLPSSGLGQISAGDIVSPLLHRSRSEALDTLSDDPMSSSPLRQVAARRLQRARTMPVLPINPLLGQSEVLIRPLTTRMHSEEFLVLEHAHVVVSSGASRMGPQELLEARQMVSKLSAVLGEEITKKITVDRNLP